MIYIWDNQIYGTSIYISNTYENIVDTIKEIHVHMTKSFSNISHFPKHTSISYWISFQFSTKHMKPLCYNLFSSGLCMFYVHIFGKWKFCVFYDFLYFKQIESYNWVHYSFYYADDWRFFAMKVEQFPDITVTMIRNFSYR